MSVFKYLWRMVSLSSALIILVSTGCVVGGRRHKINNLADRLVSEYCDDCVLVKITKARYIKKTVNNHHHVLLVFDGVVEDVISESTKDKLPVGTYVRNVDLVDDEDLTKKLLGKMNESDSLAIILGYSYAFFDEVQPPDGIQVIPVAGCFYPVFDCWLGSEDYDPEIPMEESDIVEAFRRRASLRPNRNVDRQ